MGKHFPLQHLQENLGKSTKRYKEIISTAVDAIMPDRNIDIDPV